MGTFKQSVAISDGNGGEERTVLAEVDTGATYTMLPDAVLRVSLGIRPTREEVFTFANGSKARLPVGDALLRAEGKEAFSPVVFGVDASECLLGATSLQALGLIADTSNHRLIPAPSLRL